MEPLEEKKFEKALNLALYYLSLKSRSTQELRDKLLGKEIEAEVVERVLNYATENKWLDDAHFAKMYIESVMHRYGAYRMKQSLRRKGIQDAVIQQAMDDLLDESAIEDETLRADEILQKKINTLSVDWALIASDYTYKSKIYRKLCQFLLNRGFSGDCVKKVVSKRLADEFFDEL